MTKALRPFGGVGTVLVAAGVAGACALTGAHYGVLAVA